MELHDHLYALGLQAGREVLRDPARLRAALTSSEVSPADVELVVEALRRGTVDSFVADLDGGVDPTYAVQTAGGRLAQHTGATPADASWAIAVLGFALGRVGENDVRRYRGPTAGPEVPHTQLRPPSHPGGGRPPAGPPPSYQPPVYQHPSPPQPMFAAPPPPWQPSPPSRPGRKSPLPIVLAVLGTLVVVVLAVVVALLVTRDDDDTAGPADPTTTATDDSSPIESTGPTASGPTASDLTSPAAPEADAVSFDDATAYTTALTAWSTSYGSASAKLRDAAATNDTQAGLQACRGIRASYYDFDLAVRSLGLTAVQPDVNEFLTVSGEIITQLDQNCAGAKAPSEILRANGRLPTTEYTTAFTDLTSAITDSAFG